MKREQLEQIKKACEVLPEKFTTGIMYDINDGCYCFWGWVIWRLDIPISINSPEAFRWVRDFIGLPHDQHKEEDLIMDTDDIIHQYHEPSKVVEEVIKLIDTKYNVEATT